MAFDDDREEKDEHDPDYDRKKRKKRFKNKSRRDFNKHDRQPNREKVKSKAYRPKIVYDPDEVWDSEWDWCE